MNGSVAYIEKHDGVNDVAGMTDDVEKMAILVPQIRRRWWNELRTCRRPLPFNIQCLFRKSPRRSSDHIQCLGSDSGCSSAAGHDARGVQTSSSDSDDQLMCLCPLQCCSSRRESWKTSVPALLAMAQDVVREVDREESISQSDAESVNETFSLQSVMTTLTWRLVK